MKNSNVKLFITFSAGILFSALTVFAATITVNTDFTGNAVQYLQDLVLTDASGVTGIVLDGSGNKIQVDNLCDSAGTNCKVTADLLTSYTENDPQVGTITDNKWCIGSGSEIVCNVTPVVDTDTQLSNSAVNTIVANAGYIKSETASIKIRSDGSMVIPLEEPIQGEDTGNMYYDASTNQLKIYNRATTHWDFVQLN